MNLIELLRDADRKLDTGEITIGEYEKMIAPLKDAVPVRHGRWIKRRYWSEGVGMGERYGYFYSCSKCGNLVCGGYDECGKKYCDECGARMDGKDGEQHD